MRQLRNPHFWVILALTALFTFFQYTDLLSFPFGPASGSHFLLSQYSLGRILFLVPIIYAGLVFGFAAGIGVTLATLIVSLPRAAFLAGSSLDALLEIAGIVVVGVVINVLFRMQSKEKSRTLAAFEELEKVRTNLQSNFDSLTINEHRLAKLNSLSTALFNPLESEGVFHKATELIADLMSAEIVLLFSLDETRQILRLESDEGISEAFANNVRTIEVGNGLYGQVAQHGRPVITPDSSHDPTVHTEEYRKMRIQSQLIVPMILKGKIVGVVCVAARRPQRFTSYDMELLTTLGNQVAVAIENARLYEAQRDIAERLAVSEGNYRRLLEHASDAIWAHDVNGKIIAANRAAGILAGYDSADEMIGRDIRESLTWNGLTIARKIRQSLLENISFPQPYEQHLIKKDGSEIILMMTTSLIRQNDESPIFEHVARDVTQERHLQDNLRHYVQQVTRSQEEERARIARELHDDTAQALYALTRQIDNYLRSSGSYLSTETSQFMKNLGEQIRNALQGVRRFSQNLRPPMLDDLGLLATLRWLVRDIQQRCGMEAVLNVAGVERRLPSYIELEVFRVVQEALRNVEKHAQATRVNVTMTFEADRITITVTDNGKGFQLDGELSDLPRGGRLGLVGMEERVRLLGGNLNIRSDLNKGTTVVIKVPIQN